jgi:hypothetical protein
MPPLYPLPVPAGVNVAQLGASAAWNATMPPTIGFLLNRPYAYLWQSVAQVLPGNVNQPWTPISLDSGVDNAGAHSTTVNNSRYVCQLPGLYHVVGQLGMQTPAIDGTAERTSQLSIAVNGSTGYSAAPLRFDAGPANAGGTVQAAAYVQLRLGYYVELYGLPYFNPITTFTDYRRPTMFVHWVSHL